MLSERAKRMASMTPDVVVDLWLYPTDQGGKTIAIQPGWGSPCTIQSEKGSGWIGYDGFPLLGDAAMTPGERRRVGYKFLMGKEAVDHLSTVPKFYIWESRIVGEAIIVKSEISN